MKYLVLSIISLFAFVALAKGGFTVEPIIDGMASFLARSVGINVLYVLVFGLLVLAVFCIREARR